MIPKKPRRDRRSEATAVEDFKRSSPKETFAVTQEQNSDVLEGAKNVFFTDDEWSSSCVVVAKSVASRIEVTRNSLRIGALICRNPRGMRCQGISSSSKMNNSSSIQPEETITKSQTAEKGSNNLNVPERMTVQELKTKLRSMGGSTKGSKRDLISAFKEFFDEEVDDSHEVGEDEESQLDQVEGEKSSKTKAKSLCIEQHNEVTSTVSVYKRIKIREKQTTKDPNIAMANSKEIENCNKNETLEHEESHKLNQVKGEKGSKMKAKSSHIEQHTEVTSTVSADKRIKARAKQTTKVPNITLENSKDIENGNKNDVLEHEAEPWTVLAHKKPKKEWVAYNPKTMRPPALNGDTKHVKIMSWNVNGLRALLKLESFSALELAQREDFDILCLQETKLQEKNVEEIKQSLLEGYENSFWTCSVSKLGYSGTAIISRIPPLSVRYGLGISDHDSEGRLVTTEFDSFYLISGYVPNSGDGLKRLSYRIADWDPSLSNYMKELEKSKPVILTGDLNCAHEEIDIFNPAGNKRSAGFTIEERTSFEDNFLKKGFVDTFRNHHPNVVGYTYWGFRHGGRKTNKGWRLDYFLVSESISENVHDSYILPDVAGSDHCPIGLVLKL
ncbi:hypothetical protein SSX86_015102 [Deinandra increscens subsp. villosa]|uniref:DNA-(apurinic or apyrimidinic site) endonuclease n=1 Tax=Deinandra increscens subsp. villosa TaxID=3103831 RepID=A0AAP0GXX5_9ASTR